MNARLRVAKASFVAASLLMPAIAYAQEAESIAPEGRPEESLMASAAISGGVVTGIQLEGPASSTRPQLWAAVPAAWQGSRVCLRLVSSNGRYTAQQAYRVADDWAGGVTRLRYETAYSADLQSEEFSSMAVRLTRGECGTVAAVYALTGWNTGYPAKIEKGVLLVNSFRASEVYLIDRATGKDIPCQPMGVDAQTSFDTKCPLPLEILTGAGRLELEINSVRRGTFDPVVLVSIEKTAF